MAGPPYQSSLAGMRGRERVAELWRRIRLEYRVEILFGAAFQYVHAMSTQLAHRMHRPQAEPLHDVGFDLLPELGADNAWASELIFWTLFIPFVIWTFSPFVTERKRFYTAVIYARLLMVLTMCQMLRIVSFTVTQLPAPNYHCRADRTDTAVRAPATAWWEHVVVDLGRQTTHGCGDLVFSSHTTFVLVGCLTYQEYGARRRLKLIAWAGVVLMGMCIVASRKHYTVDVVVAFYVVPLVFYAMLRRWTTVRPLHESWPHRPILGEEGVKVFGVEMLGVDGAASKGAGDPGDRLGSHGASGGDAPPAYSVHALPGSKARGAALAAVGRSSGLHDEVEAGVGASAGAGNGVSTLAGKRDAGPNGFPAAPNGFSSGVFQRVPTAPAPPTPRTAHPETRGEGPGQHYRDETGAPFPHVLQLSPPHGTDEPVATASGAAQRGSARDAPRGAPDDDPETAARRGSRAPPRPTQAGDGQGCGLM